MGKDLSGAFGSSWRVPAKAAWRYPSIELRPENSFSCIILDYDIPDAVIELYGQSYAGEWPKPNWVVQRVSNGHSHAVWCLAKPVHRGADAREHPLKYLSRCAEWLAQTTAADRSYGGVLTHNPYGRSRGRRGRLKTHWGARQPYALSDLALYVPKGWRMPREPVTAEGRNWALFSDCMRWAGSSRNLGGDVIEYARERNRLYVCPVEGVMSDGRVQGIARSVERYRARWIAQGRMGPDHSPDLQAARGKLSGAARRAKVAGRDHNIVSLASEGYSARAISRATGTPRRTVDHVLKRDAPMWQLRPGRPGTQPWVDLACSEHNGQ